MGSEMCIRDRSHSPARALRRRLHHRSRSLSPPIHRPRPSHPSPSRTNERNESINPSKYTPPPHSARHANRRVSGPTHPRVTTRQITHTRVRVPSVDPRPLTSHDSSNHPHPRAVDPSPFSRVLADASTSRVDRSRRVVSSSSSSTRVASASTARTTARMKIHSFRLRRARQRVDVDRDGERERSDDRATLDRRFARSTRRTEGRIGDRATRSRASAVREFEVNESMRTNRWDRIGSTRRVGSRPRLANDCANDARE